MKKQLFALMVAMMLVMTLLAGCGGDSTTSNPTEAPKTSAAVATPTPTTNESGDPTDEPTASPTEAPTPTPTPEPTVIGNYNCYYVTDGLVALYEGYYNTTDGLNAESTTWYDLSGNGNNITDIVLSDKVGFSEKGFSVSTSEIKLPDVLLETVNSNQFTVEFLLTDLVPTGSAYCTFINSKANDNFALFVQSQSDYLEFKIGSNQRPSTRNNGLGGLDLVEGKTVSVVFDLDEGFSSLYVDGEEIDYQEVSTTLGAEGYLFIGHPDPVKCYDANYQSIRFYNRALTTDEIEHNAAVEKGITPVA